MAKRMTMTEDLAARIASEYAKSGFGSKSDAMIAAGMPPEYAKANGGYKMFGGKLVQEALQAIVDGSPAASEISIDSIVEALAELAYPPPGEDVSDANRINALDKLAKIRQAYRDGAADTEKLDEIRGAMSSEEVLFRQFYTRMRCTELSSAGGTSSEEKAAFRESKVAEAQAKFPNLILEVETELKGICDGD